MHVGYLILRCFNLAIFTTLICGCFLGMVAKGFFFSFWQGVRGEDNMDQMFSIMVLLFFIYFAYLFLYIFKEYLWLLQLLRKLNILNQSLNKLYKFIRSGFSELKKKMVKKDFHRKKNAPAKPVNYKN